MIQIENGINQKNQTLRKTIFVKQLENEVFY